MSEHEPQSWWQRNWKWVVPVGCLTPFLIMAACTGGILLAVKWAVESSDAYDLALEAARADPEVVAALGEPIETGLLFTGTINVSGNSGEADLAVPLRGPEGEGTLYIIAERRARRWDFDLLEVEVDGRRERIDLLRRMDAEDH